MATGSRRLHLTHQHDRRGGNNDAYMERLGGGDGVGRSGRSELERMIRPHAPDRYLRLATA